MKLEDVNNERSENKCDLCKSTAPVVIYEVVPQIGSYDDSIIRICGKCKAQIEKKEEPDSSHWSKCLPESMWSEVPGVQVVSWRMLNRYRNESWAADNLDMMYLDDEKLAVAKATGDHDNDGTVELHKDCDGNILHAGDTVTLTKPLDVKGSSLHAKMSTIVKNIRLDSENTEQIEGKIEGQLIVILTKYVRKQLV